MFWWLAAGCKSGSFMILKSIEQCWCFVPGMHYARSRDNELNVCVFSLCDSILDLRDLDYGNRNTDDDNRPMINQQ
jgi:hypothetical protein